MESKCCPHEKQKFDIESKELINPNNLKSFGGSIIRNNKLKILFFRMFTVLITTIGALINILVT